MGRAVLHRGSRVRWLTALVVAFIAAVALSCTPGDPDPSDDSVAPEQEPTPDTAPETAPESVPGDDPDDQPDETVESEDEPTPPAAAALTEATTGPSGPLVPSGPIVTSEDGQVIEDLEVTAPEDIPAAIIIEHDDVTVRNVKIISPGETSGIRIEEGTTGTEIEHVEIDGRKAEYGNGRRDANFGNDGIVAYAPISARRNYIYDVRQGVQLWAGAAGSTVVENYIREVWRNAPGVSTTGISFRGSEESDELTTISRNHVTTSGMSGVSLSARRGPVRNVNVFENYIVGTAGEQDEITGYAIRGGYRGEHMAENHDVKIAGNRFDGAYRWGTNAAVNVDQPGNTFSDNRYVGEDKAEEPQRDQ